MMTTASSLDRVHGCRSSSQLQLSSQVFLRCEYHFHRVIFSTLVKAAQQTLITHSVRVCVCVCAEISSNAGNTFCHGGRYAEKEATDSVWGSLEVLCQ